MAHVLVVRMTIKEGEEERAFDVARRLVEATRTEPGNVLYIAHRDPEDPRVLLMYEQYEDAAAFEAHGQAEHFKDLGLGQLFPLMEHRERAIYETLD